MEKHLLKLELRTAVLEEGAEIQEERLEDVVHDLKLLISHITTINQWISSQFGVELINKKSKAPPYTYRFGAEEDEEEEVSVSASAEEEDTIIVVDISQMSPASSASTAHPAPAPPGTRVLEEENMTFASSLMLSGLEEKFILPSSNYQQGPLPFNQRRDHDHDVEVVVGGSGKVSKSRQTPQLTVIQACQVHLVDIANSVVPRKSSNDEHGCPELIDGSGGRVEEVEEEVAQLKVEVEQVDKDKVPVVQSQDLTAVSAALLVVSDNPPQASSGIIIGEENSENGSKEQPPSGKERMTRKRGFPCLYCHKLFKKRDKLNVHVRTHTGEKPFSCTVCHRKFTKSWTMKVHMRTHTGEKPYSCPTCHKLFRSSGGRNSHMAIHTDDDNNTGKTISEEEELIQFILPNTIAVTCSSMGSIVSTGQEENLVDSCTHTNQTTQLQLIDGRGSGRVEEVEVAMKVEEQVGKVLQSQDLTAVSAALLVVNDNPRPQASGGVIEENSLHRTLKNNIEHLLDGGKGKDDEEQQQMTRNRFPCHYCHKSFKRKDKFNAHLRTHTGEKPFSCTVCHQKFTKSWTMKVHMRTHTGEKPYSCPTCHKLFSSSGGRNTHMAIHTNERPFSCQQCPATFRQRGSLDKHLIFHRVERPYACKLCDSRFFSQASRDQHVSHAHKRAEIYKCSSCGIFCRNSEELNVHISQVHNHNNEIPTQLKVHIGQHHKKGDLIEEEEVKVEQLERNEIMILPD